jgi:hypothetical protein
MKKALAYIRFSSDEQKDGNSIDRQTANVSRYAERYGPAHREGAPRRGQKRL